MLLDAAMGTRLIASGLDLDDDDPCLWNLARPEPVAAIHRADVAAGAEAVFTNTFGANRSWLARFDPKASVTAINRQAVTLARLEAGPDRFVVGSIGPTAMVDPMTILEQAEALLDAGADALALETYRFEQAITALDHLKGIDHPILVGLFTWPDSIAATAHRLIDQGASVVGANCFADLDFAFRLIDELRASDDRPFWLKPSTGPPDATLNPEDFARLAARLASAGAGLLGGCCGTSDVHLGAIRDVWENR